MKRQIAFDKTFNIFIVIGIIFLYSSYVFFSENTIGWGIATCMIGLLFFVLTLIFVPCVYIFDKEGITIQYVFLKKERYLWKKIKAVEVTNDSVIAGASGALFNALFFTAFEIRGRVEGEYRLHMNGHIRKSLRTKKLLEKYWDGTITGYFFDDIKSWLKKQKRKKSKDKNRKNNGK